MINPKAFAPYISAFTIGLVVQGIAFAMPQKWQLLGSIDDRYEIKMNLEQQGNKVNGSYSYVSKGMPLKLSGTMDESGKLTLNESDSNGKTTGTFVGRMVQGKRFLGDWTAASKKKTAAEVPKLSFLLASEGDSSALGDGTDGIIISQVIRKLVKQKNDGGAKPVANVSYPVLMKKFIPDQALCKKIESAISLKQLMGDSIEKIVADIKSGYTWLDSVDYYVLYNKNHLLSLVMDVSGCGAYPSRSQTRVLVNTANGQMLKGKDCFKASSIPKLQALIKQSLYANMREKMKEFAGEIDAQNAVKTLAEESLKNPIDIDQIIITANGITFNHDWEIPHVSLAAAPSETCFFNYKAMKEYIREDGPLAFVLKTETPIHP